MPDRRVDPRDAADLEGEARRVLERHAADRDPALELMRTVAACPELVGSLAAHLRAVMSEGEVPRLLKELIAVRVASRDHCRYGLAAHTAAARRLGARDDWLLAVRHEEPEPGTGGTGSLDDMERGWVVALRYAELVADSGHRVDDRSYAKLAAQWTDRAIVEITAVIGLCGYVNRLSDALHVAVVP